MSEPTSEPLHEPTSEPLDEPTSGPMNDPSTPGVSRNDGIIIGGQASVSDSALAAGRGAHAEYHGGGAAQLAAVRRELDEIRALLERPLADTDLTQPQQAAVAAAVDDAEQALAATRAGGPLQRLTERLHLLAACLTGTSALAQSADQLRHVIAGLVG